ncbi:MAG: hypothetical protein GX660_16830 [Clostridiaceae bacterium]|nr:hypothetical protein [Clostridiaceae bacterium]
MLRSIFEILLCILASYGLISLVYDMVLSIRNKINYDNSMARLVLIVKNQGEVIEGVLRNALSRDFLRKLMPEGRLTILDMGSKDDTLDILRKLEVDFECIEVLKRNEMEALLKRFDEHEDKEPGTDNIKKAVMK